MNSFFLSFPHSKGSVQMLVNKVQNLTLKQHFQRCSKILNNLGTQDEQTILELVEPTSANHIKLL